MKDTIYLVTGATGFLGSNVEAINREGRQSKDLCITE